MIYVMWLANTHKHAPKEIFGYGGVLGIKEVDSESPMLQILSNTSIASTIV